MVNINHDRTIDTTSDVGDALIGELGASSGCQLPRFRRPSACTGWTPVTTTPPEDLDPFGEGTWVGIAYQFNTRTVPNGLDGAIYRTCTSPPWRAPLVIRHKGCGGVCGTVLDIEGLRVLGVLDPDGLYRGFEILRFLAPTPHDRDRLAAATTTIDHAHCKACHQTVPLGPARPALRNLPGVRTKRQTLFI